MELKTNEELTGSVLTLEGASSKPETFYEELSRLKMPLHSQIDVSKENIMKVLREGNFIVVINDDQQKIVLMAVIIATSTLSGNGWLMGEMLDHPESSPSLSREARNIVYEQRDILLKNCGVTCSLRGLQSLFEY